MRGGSRSRRTGTGSRPPTGAVFRRCGGERVGKRPSVRIGRMCRSEPNVSEPLTTSHRAQAASEPGTAPGARDGFGWCLFMARTAPGMEAAGLSRSPLHGTPEPVVPMQSETRNRRPRERLSTDAEHRAEAPACRVAFAVSVSRRPGRWLSRAGRWSAPTPPSGRHQPRQRFGNGQRVSPAWRCRDRSADPFGLRCRHGDDVPLDLAQNDEATPRTPSLSTSELRCRDR